MLNIFIDLDDTLLDFEKEEYVALKKALPKMGLPATEQNIADYRVINRKLWDTPNRPFIRIERFRILFEQKGIELDPKVASAIYEEALSEGYALMPYAHEVLTELSKKHHIHLATNGVEYIQNSRIENADIKKYFKNIFVSSKIGYEKPEKEFFDHCFASVDNFDKARAIMIGDRLSTDILGGNNAGIATCWINPHGDPETDVKATYEIRSLDQLIPIIESLDK